MNAEVNWYFILVWHNIARVHALQQSYYISLKTKCKLWLFLNAFKRQTDKHISYFASTITHMCCSCHFDLLSVWYLCRAYGGKIKVFIYDCGKILSWFYFHLKFVQELKWTNNQLLLCQYWSRHAGLSLKLILEKKKYLF